MTRSRRALSILEVLIACVILGTVMIPLLDVMSGGIRTTRATVHELVGTALAAEVAEQLETVPFEELQRAVSEGARTFTHGEGSLADGASLGSGLETRFRLSELPLRFDRILVLFPRGRDRVLAEVRVSWDLGRGRHREILFKRVLAREVFDGR